MSNKKDPLDSLDNDIDDSLDNVFHFDNDTTIDPVMFGRYDKGSHTDADDDDDLDKKSKNKPKGNSER